MRRKLITWGLILALLLCGCKTSEEAGQKTGGVSASPTGISGEPSATPKQPSFQEPTGTGVPDDTESVTPEPTEEPEITDGITAGPTEAPTPTGAPSPTKAPTPIEAPSPTEALTPTGTPNPTKIPTPTGAPSPTKAPTPTKAPSPTKKPAPVPTDTPTPKPTQAAVSELERITVNGKKISVGDSVSALTAALGAPARKDKADGNFTYYVYNQDYRNFSMVAVSDTSKQVVGFFVCSVNFGYGGLNSSSTVSGFQSKYGGKAAELSNLGAKKLTDSAGTAVFFFDIHNDSTLYAVSYMASSVSWKETDGSRQTAVEKEIFDICNAYRARYGVGRLIWSEDAAGIAKAYAKKMAAEDFFSHVSPDGSTLASRTASLNYRTVGENIIANYMLLGHLSWKLSGAAANATGWIASEGHRSNILNAAFTHLGVGITDGSTTSSYTDYGVQVFYTPR